MALPETLQPDLLALNEIVPACIGKEISLRMCKKNWDGKSGQSMYRHELETIIQRGTTFQVTKVEKSSKGIFIDMDVVEQIEVKK